MSERPGESPKLSEENIVERARRSLGDLQAQIGLQAAELPKTKIDKAPEQPKTKADKGLERPKTNEELMATIQTKKGEEREAAIREIIKKDDIPKFRDVKTTMNGHEVVFRITEDGLKLPDGMRIPVTAETAQRIAKQFGYILPTQSMIDAVLRDPNFEKVVMPTESPGAAMDSYEYYQRHHNRIDESRIDKNKPVITNKIIIIGQKLVGQPNMLFYGGWKLDGTLWQDKNSTLAHDPRYVDYAQEARVVDPEHFEVDGEKMTMAEAERRWPGILGEGANFDPYAFYKTQPGPEPVFSGGHGHGQDHKGADGGAGVFTAPVKPPPTATPESKLTAPLEPKPTEEKSVDVPPKVSAGAPVLEQTEAKAVDMPTAPAGPSQVESPVARSYAVESPVARLSVAGPAVEEPLTLNPTTPYTTPDVPKVSAAPLPAAPKTTPASPETKFQKETPERSSERPSLKGSWLFAGDSIMKGTPESSGLKVDGKVKTLAEVSRRSDQLLQEVRKFADSGEIADFKNFACLIGVNDIAGSKSAVEIFQNIQEIWSIAKHAGLKVYACTLPPFGGYWSGETYLKNDATRRELNNLIMKAGERGDVHVVKLDTLMSDGNGERLAKKYDSPDHLHPNKAPLDELLQSEIIAIENGHG